MTPSSICYYAGAWHEGPTPIMDSETNAAWMANTVFDGARAFAGAAPTVETGRLRSFIAPSPHPSGPRHQF